MWSRSSVSRGASVPLLGALLLTSCGTTPSTPSDDPATVGILRIVPSADHATFVEELQAQGWTLGRNVRILPEDPDDLYASQDEARAALRDWRRDDLDLVVAYSTPFAQLVQEETGLPGLFVVNDPIAGGLTTDLTHPDGQLTGISWSTPADRTLDVTARVVGGIERVAYLQPADDPAVVGHRTGVIEAAQRLGIEVMDITFEGAADLPAAADALAAADVDAVYLSNANAAANVADALRATLTPLALPVMANISFFDFAMVSLTPDTAELSRQLARQAARVLDGAPVASVPVEDPRRFLITIDRTRAEALGYAVDPDVLRLADVVR